MKSAPLLVVWIVICGMAAGCGKGGASPNATAQVKQEDGKAASAEAKESEEKFVSKQEVSAVSTSTAKEIAATNSLSLKVLIADARTITEYREGHIPCAMSFSVDEIDRGNPSPLISMLRKDTDVIIYANDAASPETSRLRKYLEQRGFSTRTYKNGYKEWLEALMQIENVPSGEPVYGYQTPAPKE